MFFMNGFHHSFKENMTLCDSFSLLKSREDEAAQAKQHPIAAFHISPHTVDTHMHHDTVSVQ